MALSRINADSIADGTVIASDIADGTITAVKIAAGAITGNTLSTNIINANNIVDGTITGAKIALATITGDKIGVGQITSNLFASGAVSTSNVSNGTSNVSVTSANGNVTIGTAGSERMRIDSVGQVGIGTTTPSNFGNSNNRGLTVNGSGTAGFVEMQSSGTAYGAVYANSSQAGIRSITALPLLFETNTTERMRIDSSGNVGIGTSSPAQKLHVASASATYIQVQNTGNSVNAYYGVDTGGGWMGTSTNHYAAFYTNNTERMRLDTSGNLQFNSGYGSIATAFGCRAWVNFNGTGTVAIRGSGNVSSITDNGTGDYTINYTTAMPDGNYSIVGFTRSDNNDNPAANFSMGSSYSPETGSARIMTGVSNSKIDFGVICAAVFR